MAILPPTVRRCRGQGDRQGSDSAQAWHSLYIGREAALLPLLTTLPDRMLDRILAAALRPHFSKESN